MKAIRVFLRVNLWLNVFYDDGRTYRMIGSLLWTCNCTSGVLKLSSSVRLVIRHSG